MFSNNIRFIPKRKGERHESISLINDTKEILNWKTKYKLKEYIDGQKQTYKKGINFKST